MLLRVGVAQKLPIVLGCVAWHQRYHTLWSGIHFLRTSPALREVRNVMILVLQYKLTLFSLPRSCFCHQHVKNWPLDIYFLIRVFNHLTCHVIATPIYTGDRLHAWYVTKTVTKPFVRLFNWPSNFIKIATQPKMARWIRWFPVPNPQRQKGVGPYCIQMFI